MAQRGISEYDAKALLSRSWSDFFGDEYTYQFRAVSIQQSSDLSDSVKAQPWLSTLPLVVKPDMLFGKRGKNDLVYYKQTNPGDVTLENAIQWINDKQKQSKTLLDGSTGDLTRFIVEPFIPHEQSAEYYVSFRFDGLDDVISMSASGGVDIEDNWDSVTEIRVSVDSEDSDATALIVSQVPDTISETETFGDIVARLYQFYKETHFAYLEFNPIIIQGRDIYILDTVAKLDDTAGFLMAEQWGPMEFPTAFGRAEMTEEESLISDMDENSGASLKLTVLNPKGRVWTMVAGGGASVVFSDTIADTWGVDELATYGEYSGNPSTQETAVYAKTLLDLMTREKDPQGREKSFINWWSHCKLYGCCQKHLMGLFKPSKSMRIK